MNATERCPVKIVNFYGGKPIAVGCPGFIVMEDLCDVAGLASVGPGMTLNQIKMV
jgi:hypothetical protein